MASKKILLMRHARSSHDQGGLRDFDRPLNSRGNMEALRMGRYLKELELIPGLIISSPAVRAKSTALLLIGELGLDEEVILWEDDFYFGNAAAYLKAVQQAGNHINTVMTVGHNPMTESAIINLSDIPIDKRVPTAAVACFDAGAGSWSEIRAGSCKMLWMMTPEMLNKE